MKVAEMPSSLRPREKALALGIRSLNDVELLAIILRSGYKGKSVLTLANELLDKYPLNQLANININTLMKIKGIKESKALELLAAFEISKRVNLYDSKVNDVILNPQSLFEFIKSEIGSLSNEQFLVVCLNTKNMIINYKILFKGTLDMSIVHPRDVYKFAIENNAKKIICAHNHPSGDITPSKADLKITKLLKESGEIVGIEFLDHLIVSNSEVYSIIGSLKTNSF